MRKRDAHKRLNCGHKCYHLTCAELGALEAASGGSCGICGTTMDVTALCIDHDHAIGARAIRGMVCPLCNRRLFAVDAGKRPPSEAQTAYLASPWYRRVGFSGACPPHCWNSEHRMWLIKALERAA